MRIILKPLAFHPTALLLMVGLAAESMLGEPPPAPVKSNPGSSASSARKIAPVQTSSNGGTHGPTVGGASHGPTTGGTAAGQGASTGTTHGPTTGGTAAGQGTSTGTTHGPTTGGTAAGQGTSTGTTHGPTPGGTAADQGTTTPGTTQGPTPGGPVADQGTTPGTPHGSSTGGTLQGSGIGGPHGAAAPGTAATLGPTRGEGAVPPPDLPFKDAASKSGPALEATALMATDPWQAAARFRPLVQEMPASVELNANYLAALYHARKPWDFDQGLTHAAAAGVTTRMMFKVPAFRSAMVEERNTLKANGRGVLPANTMEKVISGL